MVSSSPWQAAFDRWVSSNVSSQDAVVDAALHYIVRVITKALATWRDASAAGGDRQRLLKDACRHFKGITVTVTVTAIIVTVIVTVHYNTIPSPSLHLHHRHRPHITITITITRHLQGATRSKRLRNAGSALQRWRMTAMPRYATRMADRPISHLSHTCLTHLSDTCLTPV